MNDQLINNLAKYIKLTTEEEEFVLNLFERQILRKKEYLLRIGEFCKYDYFISRGCVKVCYNDDEGNECIIKFALEDWWVTDLDSFLNNKPSFYYIQTLEDTEVLKISKSNHELLTKTLTKFHSFSAERWQQGFIALQQRILQHITMSAKDRYCHFVNKYPSLEQRIPQKLIASYLGITPEFLSTLRKRRATRIS